MVRTWTVEIQLFETDDDTTAHAVLHAEAGGRELHGHGRARRNPSDQPVAEIGDELAAARALRDVATRLLETASGDISALEHHEVHLQR